MRRALRSWRSASSAALFSASLVHEPAGFPALVPARNLAAPLVHVTALSNGLRVASQETFGQVSSISLFIDAGSMYETESAGAEGSLIGACHFLETMAFKSTASRSALEVAEFTSSHGISTGAVFNREVLMYKIDCLRSDVSESLALLAEAVLYPRLSEAELEEARRVIAFQRDEALSQPQVLVSEHLYTAAYGVGTPLGRPEKCPDARIGAIDAETLQRFMARHFRPQRMVLSAVGLDHATALALAERFFGTSGGAASAAHAPSVRPPAIYIGGDVRSSPNWSNMPATVAAATAKTEFTHMMLAFPTCGWSDDDVVPICVVDTLLGGGSSFSAGGPGKGMYSRLYREVLNAHAWVDAANAFSTQLFDSGIVGIYASAAPAQAGALASTVAAQLTRLAVQPVKPTELARARNQLASSVLMNLETRALLCEDIGRQILSKGKRMEPEKLVARIQAVTAGDISRVMRKALAHPPSFAVVGDDGPNLPPYAELSEFFAEAAQRAASGTPSLPNKTSLFA